MQLMFYGALTLWLGLNMWARFDPDPKTSTNLKPMTPSEFNKWCVARCWSVLVCAWRVRY
jgi:hypothetical protein